MRVIAFLLLAAAARTVCAQDVVVYDEQLRNGFENYSYGGGSDFAHAATVHSGATAIAFTGNAFNALSFAQPVADYTVAQYRGVTLWLHGGAAGAQQLRVILELDGAVVANAELDTYIAGGALAAGEWRLATVRFDAPPLAYAGGFDRVDLQSDVAGMQPALYVDDMTLTATPGAPLFGDGFETIEIVPAVPLLVAEPDVSGDAGEQYGCAGERITWRDAAGAPRVAFLAYNTGQVCPGGSRGGELRLFRYETPGGTRTVRAPPNGAGGFGYVVAHESGSSFCTGGGDPSSLGHFQRVFQGRHHAIFRFTQAYPRYCTTTQPATRYDLPVTIDWMIATGRDHPVWAISYDLTGVPVNALMDDSRAPYGELLFDGAATANQHATIAGVGWGDGFRFVTTTSPVTYDAAWTWNVANTVPWVKLWTTSVDATMGTVQTQTKAQHDAGGYFGANRWGSTSAAGNACTVAIGGVDHLMPCNFNWPYQSINYSLVGFSATNNTRLAWGTNFGFLGQASYPIHGSAFYGGPLAGDPRASGWPRQSYSVSVVLDRHGVDPIGAEVARVETIQSLSLTTQLGTVATTGPAGVARPDMATYAPAGYDHVYSALAFAAAGNMLDANVAVGAGVLVRPLVIVRGWTSPALPASVRLNGIELVQDADYFPSVRADVQELWITLDRTLAGAANRIQIGP